MQEMQLHLSKEREFNVYLEKEKIVIKNLSSRALEIFEELSQEIILMPNGVSLMPLRAIQQKYAVGQKTALAVLDALEEHGLITRYPRKGIVVSHQQNSKNFNPKHINLTNAAPLPKVITLGTWKSHSSIWQPIIDKFNKAFPAKRVSIKCFDDHDKKILKDSSVDFFLFPNNPYLLFSEFDSYCYMDLDLLLKNLDMNLYYDAIRVEDIHKRCFGIAPILGYSALHCNGNFFDNSTAFDWDWDDFFSCTKEIITQNPSLKYSCFLDGYLQYFFHCGINFCEPDTNLVKFDYDNLAPALERLKKMVDNRCIPIFSDVYEQNSQYNDFINSDIATIEHSLSLDIDTNFTRLIRPLPMAKRARPILSSEVFCISAMTMKYECCWEFIKFALSEENQCDFAENYRRIPVRRNITMESVDEQIQKINHFVASNGVRSRDDFYFSRESRYMLEVGIDRWLKLGGDIKDTLKELERACQTRAQKRYT